MGVKKIHVKKRLCVKGLYKKSYRQLTGYFTLNPEDYRVVINFISNYAYYKRIVKEIDEQSETKVSIDAAANRAQAQMYIGAIEEALVKWIPAEFRDPVWEKVISEKSWRQLSDEFFFGESTLKSKWQMYVYGVATELGWNFKKKG